MPLQPGGRDPATLSPTARRTAPGGLTPCPGRQSAEGGGRYWPLLHAVRGARLTTVSSQPAGRLRPLARAFPPTSPWGHPVERSSAGEPEEAQREVKARRPPNPRATWPLALRRLEEPDCTGHCPLHARSCESIRIWSGAPSPFHRCLRSSDRSGRPPGRRRTGAFCSFMACMRAPEFHGLDQLPLCGR